MEIEEAKRTIEAAVFRSETLPPLGYWEVTESVAVLSNALKNGTDEERSRASSVLGNSGLPHAVAPLVESLKNENWKTRGVAVYSLGQLIKWMGYAKAKTEVSAAKRVAKKAIFEALESDDAYVQFQAIRVVEELRYTEAIDRVCGLLDAKGTVPLYATDALVALGANEEQVKKAFATMVRMINSKDVADEVKMAALKSAERATHKLPEGARERGLATLEKIRPQKDDSALMGRPRALRKGMAEKKRVVNVKAKNGR